jgi:hypothetical protein
VLLISGIGEIAKSPVCIVKPFNLAWVVPEPPAPLVEAAGQDPDLDWKINAWLVRVKAYQCQPEPTSTPWTPHGRLHTVKHNKRFIRHVVGKCFAKLENSSHTSFAEASVWEIHGAFDHTPDAVLISDINNDWRVAGHTL